MPESELGLPEFSYTKGLHSLGYNCYAWLQPNGSWGLSNAGLITDGEEGLLVAYVQTIFYSQRWY